jgi:hypothetical protein
MMLRRLTDRFNGLRADQRGGVLVEFALLAPFLLTLLIGVVQVGLHVQNANAVRNLASDGARFTVVEYQRDNALSADSIEAVIRSRGVGPKYNLNADFLTVDVDEPNTRIPGLKELEIRVTYSAPDYLAFVAGDALNLVYERPVFVVI